MSDRTVSTNKAPAAVGPYSQAVKASGFLFTSGALPIDPATGKMVEGDIQARTHQCLRNLQVIAQAADTSLDKAVKCTVFLADINDFKAVNEVYAQYFSEPFPARSAFQVAELPLGADVEIEAIIEL